MNLGVRWTIGNVSERGFEALRLSIWGIWSIFGSDCEYAICVNSIPLQAARERTGPVPNCVIWHDASNDFPGYLRTYFDDGMAEGVGWKFAPLRFFPEKHELCLDNDCILWELPPAIREWLNTDARDRCLIAEDVVAMFGKFAPLCGSEPRNAGIRGLPPGFDLDQVLREILSQYPHVSRSELDEQGLNVAALSIHNRPIAVSVDDVSICSPFPPHLSNLGRC